MTATLGSQVPTTGQTLKPFVSLLILPIIIFFLLKRRGKKSIKSIELKSSPSQP